MVNAVRRRLLKVGGLSAVYGLVKNFIPVIQGVAYASSNKQISDKDWKWHIRSVVHCTEGGKLDYVVGDYLTPEILKKVIDTVYKSQIEWQYNVMVNMKNIKKKLEGYEKDKSLVLIVELFPSKSTYLHPEEERKVYNGFRKAFHYLTEKDPDRVRILPEENMVKYVLKGEKVSRNALYSTYIKYINDELFLRDLEESYKTIKEHPAIGLMISRSLIPKDIVDVNKVGGKKEKVEYFTEMMFKRAFNKLNAPTPIHILAKYVDFDRKEIKFISFNEVKSTMSYSVYYKLKDEILNMLGKTLKFKNKEEMLEFLYIIRNDLAIIYGNKPPGDFPLIGIGEVKDKWKKKEFFVNYLFGNGSLGYYMNDVVDLGRQSKIILK